MSKTILSRWPRPAGGAQRPRSCAAIIGSAAVIVRAQTGVVLETMRFDPALVLTPIGMIVVGALAGLVPAFKAYRTDVASNLTPLS